MQATGSTTTADASTAHHNNNDHRRLQIYYACPVRGAKTLPIEVKRAHIAHLQRFGDVLTAHLAAEKPADCDLGLTDEDIFLKDRKWIEAADLVVAEISCPSWGVAFQLGAASCLSRSGKPGCRKKILCLHSWDAYEGSSVSAMLAGNPDMCIQAYRSVDEALRIMSAFAAQRRVFLAGPPGCGKGTQAVRIAARYGLEHVSTGDLCRQRAAMQGDPLGEKIAGFMHRGELVPAEVMDQLVAEALSERGAALRGYVLDGYPPSKGDLDNLKRRGIHPTDVLLFDCSDDIASARQNGRRTDPITGTIYAVGSPEYEALSEEEKKHLVARSTDLSEEKRNRRLEVYHQNTAEWKSWYPQDIVHIVDAEKDVQGVWQQIRSILDAPSALSMGSYYLEPLQEPEKSAQFHFHIDVATQAHLRDIVRQVHAARKQSGAPQAQIKIYPVTDLALGTQVSGPGFSGVYSGMPNFHTIHAATLGQEAFVTGFMGDKVDGPLLETVLAVASARPAFEGLMVEVEETIFTHERSTLSGTEVVHTTEDECSTDLDGIPKHPAVLKQIPRFELHHGFDIPKIGQHAHVPPLNVTDLVSELQGFDLGGWFLFGKADRWSYRSGEFSDLSRQECMERLRKQADTISQFIAKTFPGVPFAQSNSLERVHAIWHFS